MDHVHDHDGGLNSNASTTERDTVRGKLESFLAAENTDRPLEAEGDDLTGPATVLHGVERHPDDPPGALKTGVGEGSLLDPDAMRVNAVDVGITEQAVEPGAFFPLLEAEYGGLVGIRRGAVTGPALEEAGRLSAKEAATDREVAALTADGLAAADAAARHEVEVQPRLKDEAKDAKDAYEKAVAERDAFEDQAMQDPTYWTDAGAVDPTPAGGPLHWLALGANRAILAFIAEVVLGGLILSGPVAETFVIDFPFGSLLVAMALSAGFVILGFALGKVLDATRLPVRVVAGLFVLAGGYILWKGTGALDALREGERDKAKTILTCGTLSAVYVATLTSYAASVYGLFQRRRELIASIPTPTDLWRKRWQAHEAKVAETKQRLEQGETAVQSGHDHIDERKETAAGTDGRCRQREADGVTAAVGYETLKAVTGVHVAQEVSNRDAAVTAAKLAHTKIRAEAYPEPGSVATTRWPGLAAEQAGGLSVFHKWAIACLLVGAIGGLLGSQIALTLGAATAAVLLLLGLSGCAPGRTAKPPTAIPPVKQAPPVSTSPGIEEAPGWKQPPRTTRPKYAAAANDPTQHH